MSWPRDSGSPASEPTGGLASRSDVDAAVLPAMAPPQADAAVALPMDPQPGMDGTPPVRTMEPRRLPPGDGMIPPARKDPMDAMDPMADPGAPDENEALKASVLAKFRRVQAQYGAYKAKNGLRLESHWNTILQTAVYSGSDRYKRLNALLDDLTARMARSPAPEP